MNEIQARSGCEPHVHHIGLKTYYDLGTIGGANTWMVRSEMGAIGPGGSTTTAFEAIEALHPSAVIMVGIAFGVDPKKQRIGDVLVSRQLMEYELQRVGTDLQGQPVIVPRGDRVTASPRLLDRFRDGELTWKEAKVRFGLVLSGLKLVDNLDLRQKLLRLEPEAIGGEMEGAGLYDAASRRKVDWILAKAICDWADGHKRRNKAQRQSLAARNAARFVLHVLERGGLADPARQPGPRPTNVPSQPPTVSPTSSLHQLPAPPGDFVGRQAELKELTAAIEQGGAVISGVRGMGGVGKTALALQLAHRLMPRYPDAQLFLDLRGTGESPLSPAEAMAHVVRSYRPMKRPPEDERELQAMYRSLLHGQRAMLLLDNAADAAQVRPLLPPPSCLLLVTSRRHFALPGLHPLDLGVLPLDDACKLLCTIAPRIAEQAAEIARLCGCLPLALRATGSLLAVTPDLSPAEYARQLADERTRLERIGAEGVDLGVVASFNLSYGRLEAGTAGIFRLLAVFPASFDAVAEEAVCMDEGHAALSELVRRSMVEYVPPSPEGEGRGEGGRYRLHDLARLYAGARLDGEERASAQGRHAAHYVRVLAAADELYLRGGEGNLQGLALLDRERENVEAGQRWAAGHAAEDEYAARLCSAYPDAGTYCLSLRQHAQERIRWLEAAAATAQRQGERQAEGVHLGNLGLAYSDLGQVERAIEHYQQALEIAREIGDRRGEGADLGNLGLAYSNLGQVERAIGYFQRKLKIAQEIGDRRGEGNRLGNLGLAYSDLGQVERAIEHYQQALKIARDIGDRRGEGNRLGNLGNAYRNLGQVERAIEHYQQALEIASEIGDRRGEANHSWNLGLVYEESDPEQAIALMSVCVEYEREIGHPDAPAGAADIGAPGK